MSSDPHGGGARRGHHPTLSDGGAGGGAPSVFPSVSDAGVAATATHRRISSHPAAAASVAHHHGMGEEGGNRAEGGFVMPLFGRAGNILTAEEKAELRRKHGMCPSCGHVRTHEQRGAARMMKRILKGWSPLTKEGESYKGHCLKCHGGLVRVKELLGERVTAADRAAERARSDPVGTAVAKSRMSTVAAGVAAPGPAGSMDPGLGLVVGGPPSDGGGTGTGTQLSQSLQPAGLVGTLTGMAPRAGLVDGTKTRMTSREADSPLHHSLPSFPVSTVFAEPPQRPGLTRGGRGDSISTIGFQSVYMIAQEKMQREHAETLENSGQNMDAQMHHREQLMNERLGLPQQEGRNPGPPPCHGPHMNTTHPMSREQQLTSQVLARRKGNHQRLGGAADHKKSTVVHYEDRMALLRLGLDADELGDGEHSYDDAAAGGNRNHTSPHASLSDLPENGGHLDPFATPKDPVATARKKYVHPASAPAATRHPVLPHLSTSSPTARSERGVGRPPLSPDDYDDDGSDFLPALKPAQCGKAPRWGRANDASVRGSDRMAMMERRSSSVSSSSSVGKARGPAHEVPEKKVPAWMPMLPDIGATTKDKDNTPESEMDKEDADMAAAIAASLAAHYPPPPRAAPVAKPKVRMKELWPGGPVVPVEEEDDGNDGDRHDAGDEQSPGSGPLSKDEALSSGLYSGSGHPFSTYAQSPADAAESFLPRPSDLPQSQPTTAAMLYDAGRAGPPLEFPTRVPRAREWTSESQPPPIPVEALMLDILVETTRSQEQDSELEQEQNQKLVETQASEATSASSDRTPFQSQIPASAAMVADSPIGVKDPPPEEPPVSSSSESSQSVVTGNLEGGMIAATLPSQSGPPELVAQDCPPLVRQSPLPTPPVGGEEGEEEEGEIVRDDDAEASIKNNDDESARAGTDEFRGALRRVRNIDESASALAATCGWMQASLSRRALLDEEDQAIAGGDDCKDETLSAAAKGGNKGKVSTSGGGAALAALPGSWARVLIDAATIGRRAEDPGVRSNVLRTLWTLAAPADRLKSEVRRCGGVDLAVNSMGTFSDANVALYGAGLLGCLARSDRHAGAVLVSEGAVDALVGAAGYGGTGKDNDGSAVEAAAVSEVALRAIFHLFSFCFKEQGYFGARRLVEEMNVSSAGGDASDVLMQAMRKHRSSLGVQEWACKLLWAMLAADDVAGRNDQDEKSGEQEDSRVEDISSAGPILKVSQNLVDVVSSSAAESDHNPGAALIYLQLLCQLSSVQLVSVCPEMVTHVADGAIRAMQVHPNSVEVQVLGCTVISVLCCGSSRPQAETDGIESDTATVHSGSVISRLGGPGILTRLLKDHPRNHAVVSGACMALACLCAGDQLSKQACLDAGVIRSVVKAYRAQVGSMSQRSRDVREKAGLVLASVSASPDQLGALNGCGVMVDLIKSAIEDARSPSSNGVGGGAAFVVPPAVLNLLASNCLAGDASAKAATTSTTVKFVLQNYRREEEAEHALLMLQSLTTTKDCAQLLLMSSGALDRITGAMDSFKDNAALQENGCGILSNTFVNGGDRYRASICGNSGPSGAPQVVETIIRALQSHRSHDGVQEIAILALRNFCAYMPQLVVASDSTLHALVDVLDDVIISMERNSNNVAIRRNGAGFIWALARVDDDVCQTLACSDAVKLISESFQQYPDDEIMQQEAIGAMATLARVPDTHLILGSELVVHSIILCMASFDDHQDINENGCSLLAALTNDSFQVKVNIVDNEMSISQLIGCMYRYEDSPVVQCEACTALAHLAMDNFLKIQIANEGGIDRIQCALDKHRLNPSVTEQACGALANLISGTEADILRGNDVVAKVVAAAESYPDLVELQEKCVTVLWNLSVKDDRLKEDIAHHRGIRAVVNAMQLHISSEQVQEKGCVTLWSLAVLDEAQERIGRGGGIEAIINGSMAHVTCAQLQTEVIGVLRSLATNPDNKEKIKECSGVESIVNIMFVHYSNSVIQESACSALSNIAVNPTTNQVSALVGNELDAIVNAMNSFPLVESVQKQACVLLRNYTFQASNVEAMKSNDMLVTLLQMAAETFPTGCAERTKYILTRIRT